ncbi:peptidoglycan/LPS O-acetylase OafA/YrhL [Duganella sp. 1411]|uniref:acyltransferase family protein n=1 Tax=Duganella sp. 1411 TaxID=2806572 RepID=UPI001AE2A1EF|nr:acyltransferase [Duganella sp. 1411]MBP1207904.1 peptidoglycan/LPS O-acetylase OafA/YrhL [Duganella sp. 1411]
MTVTASPAPKQHLLGIDVLRFAAALMVLFFHFCYLITVSPHGFIGNASRQAVTFPEMTPFSHFGWVGVQIFFVISGFVIAFSGEKATPFGFLSSRVVRLGPGAWICAPLTLLATIAVGFSPAEEMYRGLRHSMAFIPWGPWIDGSYWTLGIEVAFYATVLGIISLGRFPLVRPLAMVLGAVSALFWLAVTVTDPASGLGLKLAAARGSRLVALLLVHHGIFFALGVFLWLELVKRPARANQMWIGALLVAGCVQIVADNAHGNAEFGAHHGALAPCATWLLAMAFMVWSVKANAHWHRLPGAARAAIRTAGMMTFPLYLLHQVVGGAILGALVLGGWNRWNALAATVALVLAASWLIAKHLEPALQRLTKQALMLIRAYLPGDVRRAS